MKNKKKWICLGISIFVAYLVIQVAVIHFFTPYIDLNNMIIYMNSNDLDFSSDLQTEEEREILKLRILDDISLENVYTNIRTKKKLTSMAVNRMSYDCDIYVKVIDSETSECIAEYHEAKTVTFYYSDFCWYIESIYE